MAHAAQTVRSSRLRKPALDRRDVHRELVEEYGGLVRTVARRIHRRLPPHARGFEEEDLVSVGVIGLLDAHDRYEPQEGVAFSSFAEFRIRGAILDEIRRHDFFPRRLRAKANKLRKTKAGLEAGLGREPTDEEVAAEMEISLSELLDLRAEVAPYHFVDNDDECITLRSPFPDPARVLLEKEMYERVLRLLSGLRERHQLVLDLYFNKELKLREIAEVLSVSEGRVSQIKSEAIEVLRERLGEVGARTH